MIEKKVQCTVHCVPVFSEGLRSGIELRDGAQGSASSAGGVPGSRDRRTFTAAPSGRSFREGPQGLAFRHAPELGGGRDLRTYSSDTRRGRAGGGGQGQSLRSGEGSSPPLRIVGGAILGSVRGVRRRSGTSDGCGATGGGFVRFFSPRREQGIPLTVRAPLPPSLPPSLPPARPKKAEAKPRRFREGPLAARGPRFPGEKNVRPFGPERAPAVRLRAPRERPAPGLRGPEKTSVPLNRPLRGCPNYS